MARANKTQKIMDRTNSNTGKAAKKGGGLSTVPNGSISQNPPTSWSSLTDKGLITPDAYGGIGSGTMGTMTAKHQKLNGGGAGSGLSGLLSGGGLSSLNGILSGLGNIGNAITQGMQFYQQLENVAFGGGNVLERAAGVLGVSASGLGSIVGTGGPLSSIMAGADQINSFVNTLSKSSNMLLSINNEVRALSNMDFSDLSQMSNLLNRIGMATGNSNLSFLSDISGQALFAADVVNRMSKLGIPDVVKNVEGIFRGRPEAWKMFIQNTLKGSISSSDIKGLQTIVDLIGGGKVNSLSHRFPHQVAKNYSFNSHRSKTTEKIHEFDGIYHLFKSANGSAWGSRKNLGTFDLQGKYDSTKAKDLKHIDLSDITGATKDFKALWKLGTRNSGTGIQDSSEETVEKRLMGLATMYDKQTVMQAIKKHFPLAVISQNTTKKDVVVAPTNLR